MTLRSDTSMVPMPGFAAASAAWHAGRGTASPFTARSTAGGNGGKTRGWSDQARYKAALAQGHRWHGKVPEDAAPQAEMRSGPAPGIAAQIADGLRSAGLGQMAQRYLAPPSPGDAALSIVPHVIGKAVESGVRAVTAPLRAWKGEIAHEAMIEEGRNVAGFAMTGGMAIPKPANSAGIFGGRLAKTADHAALAKAETMAAEGAPRETIWKETGWFQGADKKWRFEIDDSGMRSVIAPRDWIKRDDGATMAPHLGAAVAKAAEALTPEAPIRIKRLFEHEALDRAYPYGFTASDQHPGILGVPVKLIAERDSASVAGAVVTDGPNGTTLALHETLPPRPARTTTLHEMQHLTQDHEGFAAGGTSSQFETLPPQAANEAYILNLMMQRLGGADQFPAAVDLFRQSIGHEPGLVARSAARQMAPEDIYAAVNPKAAYKLLAGEVEARAVEKRMDLSADQRRARPPWLDYDVAESQQIVRFGSTTAESRPRALSPDEEAGLIAGKRSGTSNPELAEIHGIDERTVQRILRRNGVEAGKPGRPRSYDASGLAAAHAQGVPASALAVRYGVKLSTIERRLRAIASGRRDAAKQAAE